MPRLVAKDLQRYASRDLKPGEEFDASDADAFILTRTGKAEQAKPTEGDGLNAPGASEDGGGASELFGGGQSRRGRYNRRDMRAKD